MRPDKDAAPMGGLPPRWSVIAAPMAQEVAVGVGTRGADRSGHELAERLERDGVGRPSPSLRTASPTRRMAPPGGRIRPGASCRLRGDAPIRRNGHIYLNHLTAGHSAAPRSPQNRDPGEERANPPPPWEVVSPRSRRRIRARRSGPARRATMARFLTAVDGGAVGGILVHHRPAPVRVLDEHRVLVGNARVFGRH